PSTRRGWSRWRPRGPPQRHGLGDAFSCNTAKPAEFERAGLQFHLVIQELRHRMHPQRLHDLAQGCLHVVRLVADHGHAQHGTLTIVLFLDVRHRDVEAVADAVLDALDHLPLVLEAAGFADQQANAESADDHSSVLCTCSTLNASMTSPTLM